MKTTQGTAIFPLINPTTLSRPGAANMAADVVDECVKVSINGRPYACLTSQDDAILTATDVYVDALNGDDTNDGLTPATALRTWGEYARRVNGGPVTASPWQTVHVIGDLPFDETGLITVDADYSGSGLVINGSQTVLSSGTVDAVTPWDTTTDPVVTGVVTSGGSPWTGNLGRQVVMTSGAHVGKIGWILDNDGDDATISELIDVDTFATGFPAVGDTFDIVSLTQAPSGIRLLRSGTGFVNPRFLTLSSIVEFSAREGVWLPQGCRLQVDEGTQVFLRDLTGEAIGCLYDGWRPRYVDCDLSFFTCSFRNSDVRIRRTEFTYFGINAYQWAGTQQAPWTVGKGGDLLMADGGSVGVMDLTGAQPPAAFDVDPDGAIRSFSGSGRVWTVNQTQNPAIRVNAFGQVYWANGLTAATAYSFDVSGAATEFDLGGATTDAATLGFIGTINAANNAAAVPQLI